MKQTVFRKGIFRHTLSQKNGKQETPAQQQFKKLVIF